MTTRQEEEEQQLRQFLRFRARHGCVITYSEIADGILLEDSSGLLLLEDGGFLLQE